MIFRLLKSHCSDCFNGPVCIFTPNVSMKTGFKALELQSNSVVNLAPIHSFFIPQL